MATKKPVPAEEVATSETSEAPVIEETKVEQSVEKYYMVKNTHGIRFLIVSDELDYVLNEYAQFDGYVTEDKLGNDVRFGLLKTDNPRYQAVVGKGSGVVEIDKKEYEDLIKKSRRIA